MELPYQGKQDCHIEVYDSRIHRRHQDHINKLERKFFEDKIRLQKEANRKISELAANAHRVFVVYHLKM
jgi:hypothetical protein